MLDKIKKKTEEIEDEMKSVGYWNDNPPNLIEKYNSGELKTYMDAPSFELWLQTVFLFRVRQAILNNSLPKNSQVGQMAMKEYNYHSHVPEAQKLLSLLLEFDSMIRKYASGK